MIAWLTWVVRCGMRSCSAARNSWTDFMLNYPKLGVADKVSAFAMACAVA